MMFNIIKKINLKFECYQITWYNILNQFSFGKRSLD